MSPATRAIARRALLDSRTRTIAFAYLFAAVCYANVAGYRSAYPTVAERLKLVAGFGNNNAVRLFYGKPYDLLSVGGYSAWRSAGILTIFAAAFGVLAAVRALRTEEEAGRWELVVAGIVQRHNAYLAVLAAIALQTAALWLLALLGLLITGLPVGETAYLALAIVAPVPVFAGVGAIASQLAPTRRLAIQLAGGVLAVALLARIVADTVSQLEWLRWATPLGWSEEMRPFTGSHPAVLLLVAAVSTALFTGAGLLASRRDVGAGLLPAHDSAAPRLGLLRSPTMLALREERASLITWLVGSGFFALIVGVISTSVASAGLSASVQHQLRKVANVSIITPAGYIGLSFLFFILLVSLYSCAQIAAVRGEEAEERLETLLTFPVGRSRWLAGRLLLASAGAVAIALVAGVLAWAGAAAENAGVPLWRMLEAGANCLPVALLFLALGALAYATLPRAAAAISYGLVVLAFVWQLFGGLLDAPTWLLDLSPFQHVGLVPAQPFRAGAAATMLAIALACTLAAVAMFRQRDLIGA